MRRPRVDATLSERFIDDFLARTRPLAPPPPSINAAAHSADARIAELEKLLMSSTRCTLSDGTPCHQLELDSLLRERENLTMRPTGGGRYLNDQEGFQVDVAPDGTVAIRNKPRAKIVGLTVHYDLEAILMEAVGDDAYASSKLHFLDKTRDERAELGRRDRTARLAGAAAQALAHVERLWAATRDPGQRRRALFELWDECAEAGSAELVAAGTAARRIIVGVIRARMRGADAYSAEELAALNAQRRSAAPFAPYDERLDVGAPDGGGDREGERGGDREGERGGDREGERGGDHRD